MSEPRISRRMMVASGGIAAALFASALGVTLPRLFGHRYAPTPYDDLLAFLVDRERAEKVGAAARAADPDLDTKAIARELRQLFEQRNLAEVLDADIREGRIAEVSGWVMPESLAQLCALAVV